MNHRNKKITYALVAAVIYLCVFYSYTIIHVFSQERLPPPFFGNASDYFMDFYSINYQSTQDTFYTVFRSFYSPLNLWIAKLFTDSQCIGVSSSFAYRACNPHTAVLFVTVCWVATLFFVWRFLRYSENCLLWCLVIGFSFPMAFAIERANYILLAVPILFFWLTSQGKMTLVFEILLANIKYYFLLLQASYLLRNRLGRVALFFLLLACVTMIFAWLTQMPGATLIPRNLFSFSSGAGGIDILWSSSINVFNGIYRIFWPDQTFKDLIGIGIWILKLIIFFRLWAYLAETYHTISQHQLNFLLILFLLLFSAAPGFYGLILLFPYVVYFLQQGQFDWKNQYLVILLCLPYPFLIFTSTDTYRMILFDDSVVQIPIKLYAQSIFSPLILAILFIRLTRYHALRNEFYEPGKN